MNTTVVLLSRYGLTGTTTSRIAKEVGISEPALYRHFLNKEEIILAALDAVSGVLIEKMYTAALSVEDMTEKIHMMSAALYEFVMSHSEEAAVLFEVFSGTRDSNLKQSLQNMFLGSMKIVEMMLSEGIKDGDVKPDVDVELTAWKIMSLGLTLNYAAMLGLNNVLTEDKALSAVDALLVDISTRKKERSVSE